MAPTKSKQEEPEVEETPVEETPEESSEESVPEGQASPEEITFRDPPESNDLTFEEREAAAAEHVSEGLMVGNVAAITKGEHKGGYFAITRIVTHGSVADLVRNAAGNPQQLYNSPKEVEGSFIGGPNDAVTCVLDVAENGLVKAPESWRGTRDGRRH